MAELDFDPFDCEAFPGLEFFFSGTRDMLTLNAFESAHDRKVPLLSLERRGYVVRHRVPGDFTPLPPADEGRIPLEGQPNQVPRPNRDAEPDRALRAPRFAPPAFPPRPKPPRTPDIPFAQTHLRLRRGNDPFLDPGDQQSIFLQAFVRNEWVAIAILNPNTGRLTRVYHDRYQFNAFRAAGFCISRDGGIAVANPTERERRHALPAEDLEADPVPDLDIPAEGPFADRILAFRDRLAQFGAFLDANRGLHTEIQRALRPTQIEDRFGGPGNWDGFFEGITDAYDRLRTHLVTEAEHPQPVWVHLHYRWHNPTALWILISALNLPQCPDNAPQNTADLPFPANEGRPFGATRGLPDGWNRHVWFNCGTGEIYPETHDRRPPQLPQQQILAPHQDGGGGGVNPALQRALDALPVPPAEDRPQFGGFEVTEDDPGPQSQGVLTRALRDEVYRLRDQNHLVPLGGAIITFRRGMVMRGGVAQWREYDEEAQDLVPGGYSFAELPFVGDVQPWPYGTIYRAIQIRQPDGTVTIATLTAALNQTITRLIEENLAAIAIVDEYGDDDDPEPDDNF